MTRSIRMIAILAVVACFMQIPSFGSPIISFVPSSTTVFVGQTFSLGIWITGASDLYAYQFDLGFDPGILSANSILEGSFLGGADTFFIPGGIDNTSGTISFTANTLLTAISGANGSGQLATVSFTALGAGSSPVNLFGVTLLDSTYSGIGNSVTNGTVTVQAVPAPVPEPSTLLLLGTGLALVGPLRRRILAA